jgi:hypothetical protein
MNCPHWLLALTIPFSRSDRAHTSPAGVGAGCAKGLLRTMPASLLRLPEDLGGSFRRECHCSRRVTERQRAFLRPRTSGVTRATASGIDRSGTSAATGGCPLERSRFPPRVSAQRHQVVACGRPPGLPHATRCSMRNELSAPLPSANQGVGGVRCPLLLSTTACHHDATSA